MKLQPAQRPSCGANGAWKSLPLRRSRRSRRGDEAESPGYLSRLSASSPRWLLFERAARTTCRAFTLVEVLAALAFMAIVIPVAVDGLRVASLAGQVGERKATASRIAERIMNELLVTGQYRSATQKGVIREDAREYEWSMRSEPWPLGAMRLVTVEVIFPVQGRDYDVRLSTLADNSMQ